MISSIARRRWIAFIATVALLIALALALNTCGRYPDAADDGTPWDRSWEMLGTVLGIEPPGNGLTLQENDSVLTGDDTYYAVWTAGEPSSYVNEEGDDTDLYDASLYLLLYGCADESGAEAAAAEWREKEENSYEILDTTTETINGQEYTILTYRVISESNPYERGVSAFGIYHNYVVSAELACTSAFTGDEKTMLRDFLNGCHYSSR